MDHLIEGVVDSQWGNNNIFPRLIHTSYLRTVIIAQNMINFKKLYVSHSHDNIIAFQCPSLLYTSMTVQYDVTVAKLVNLKTWH